MEFTKISNSAVKIKSKTAMLGINPLGAKTKVAMDAALFLQQTINLSELSVDGETLIISGPGEYEIKGVKISGIGRNEDLGYLARIEGAVVFVVRASSLIKSKDFNEECQILLLDADTPVEENQNIISATNAQVAVLFGAHAADIAKQLGKEVTPVSKFVTTREKLPAETEIVVLQ